MNWDDKLASTALTVLGSAQTWFPTLAASGVDLADVANKFYRHRDDRSARIESMSKGNASTPATCTALVQRAELDVDVGAAREAIESGETELDRGAEGADRIRLMVAAAAGHRFVLSATGYVVAGERAMALTDAARSEAIDAILAQRRGRGPLRRLGTAACVLGAEVVLDVSAMAPARSRLARAAGLLRGVETIADTGGVVLGGRRFVRRDHDEQVWVQRHDLALARHAYLDYRTSQVGTLDPDHHLVLSRAIWQHEGFDPDLRVEAAMLLSEQLLNRFQADPSEENLTSSLYVLHVVAEHLTLGSLRFFRFLAQYVRVLSSVDGLSAAVLHDMIVELCQGYEDDAPLFVHGLVTHQARANEHEHGWSSAVRLYDRALALRERIAASQALPAHRTIVHAINDAVPSWLARAHARLDEPAQTVEAVERGRATSLTYEVRMEAAIDDLRATGSPQLSERLRAVHHDTAHAGYAAERLRIDTGAPELPEQLLALLDQQAQLLIDVRAATGDQEIPRPLRFDVVADAARECPLVYLVPSTQESYLFCVVDGAVTTTVLADLTRADLTRRTADYLDTYLNDLEEWRRVALPDITEWLWDVVMSQVLTAVDGARVARIVACGPLSLLPLHAAWTWTGAGTERRRRYVQDAVHLSYLPTALALCRHRGDAPADPRILVVSDPANTTQEPLDSDRELRTLLARHGERVISRTADEATAAGVLHDLPECSVAHFSVHGLCDTVLSLRSSLHLAHDERLSVAHIRELDLPHLELVVLSACESALSMSASTEEITTLPMAFLETGARCVVGSLWEVDVDATAALFERFYARWVPEHGPLEVACDLGEAQRDLRRDPDFDQPWLWAGFAAIG